MLWMKRVVTLVLSVSLSLTVAIWVNGTEAVLVLDHGLLEVLVGLLHNPALHLLGANTLVLVEIHSEDRFIAYYILLLYYNLGINLLCVCMCVLSSVMTHITCLACAQQGAFDMFIPF